MKDTPSETLDLTGSSSDDDNDDGNGAGFVIPSLACQQQQYREQQNQQYQEQLKQRREVERQQLIIAEQIQPADTDTDYTPLVTSPTKPTKPLADVAPALPLCFDLAASARSSCKSSGQKIEKGAPRVGVPNPQYKGSYSWFLPQHSVSAIKQPKTKNGLKCRVCGEKFTEDLVVVGKGGKSSTVCQQCFASELGEQRNDSNDAELFYFRGDYDNVEGFEELEGGRRAEVLRCLSGEGWEPSMSTRATLGGKRKTEDEGEDEDEGDDAPASLASSPPRKKQKTNTTTKDLYVIALTWPSAHESAALQSYLQTLQRGVESSSDDGAGVWWHCFQRDGTRHISIDKVPLTPAQALDLRYSGIAAPRRLAFAGLEVNGNYGGLKLDQDSEAAVMGMVSAMGEQHGLTGAGLTAGKAHVSLLRRRRIKGATKGAFLAGGKAVEGIGVGTVEGGLRVIIKKLGPTLWTEARELF